MSSDLAITSNTSSAAAALRATQAIGRRLDASDPTVRTQAAAHLASELFFKPILAELRQFPLGKDFLSGGFAESAFTEQLDERIADAVATSTPALVKQIARELDGRAASSSTAAMRAGGGLGAGQLLGMLGRGSQAGAK